VRRRQILPQQILRHLDAIGNYAIRTHRENARQALLARESPGQTEPMV